MKDWLVGARAQRQKDFAGDDCCKITNYEKLQPGLDLIADWAPEPVIVDETRRIRNWNTIAAWALKRIDSPYAIVRTGTPRENKLQELISTVQFDDQHRPGPIWKLPHEHQPRDESGRITGYTKLPIEELSQAAQFKRRLFKKKNQSHRRFAEIGDGGLKKPTGSVPVGKRA